MFHPLQVRRGWIGGQIDRWMSVWISILNVPDMVNQSAEKYWVR